MSPIKPIYIVIGVVCSVLSVAQATPNNQYETAEDAGLVQLLAGAIQRGAPLFNAGEQEGCASIYQTAIDAAMLGSCWGLTSIERVTLATGAADAIAIADPASRAWAYRELMDSLLMPRQALLASVEASVEVSSKLLFGFNSEVEKLPWRIVLDGVMGGLSTGNIEVDGDAMVFTGSTSLQNNGGFSSIRAPIELGSLQSFDTLRIRVKGDGRSYIFGARKQYGMGGDSYWHTFETTKGQWETIDIPLESMERHFFGQQLLGMIQPGEVRGIEFYVYDKKAGPFRLEIDSIEAVQRRF
jgi:monofunctional biosynthetic peptidoglycan transglycosylase